MSSVEKTIEELNLKISRANTVLRELPASSGFKILIEDFTAQKKMIDENWHLVKDEKTLTEFRITKFAVLTLINTVQSYEADLKQATEELRKLENPETIIGKDYDNE